MSKIKLIKSISINTAPTAFTDHINVKKVHENNITGRGVKIAIIDTGCQKDHPLLSSVIISGKNFTLEGNENDFNDLNGHGTHVAGIVAGSHSGGVYGIAPNAELIICKALDKNGSGDSDSVCKAIDYAISREADIINMSLGMPHDDWNLHNAVKRAIEKGISVVCASGNSGDGRDDTDECDYPGCYEEVICVGAVDYNCNVSKFSNSNKFVDIVAPGEDIVSTVPKSQIKPMTGTSMATPCISGALALLKEWSTKEFGRKLGEMELYGELIKNTKTLKCKRTLQGHGILFLDIFSEGE